MKVKDLLVKLEEYDPDTELIVAYWDKETVEGYTDELTLSEDQWKQVVSVYENGEWFWQSCAADDFSDIAYEAYSEKEE